MKKCLLFCMLCAVIPLELSAMEVDFSRILKVGMRGNDVRALQEVLNGNVDTRIAESGIGSPGNETNYFGPATKHALVKFQEKYRAEILTPVGLVSGNGVFGAKTRAQVLAVRQNLRTPAFVPITISSTTLPSVVEKGEVIVMSLSQYSGKPGTMMTIDGAGFTPTDNTIYFGAAHAVERAASQGGQAIALAVPFIPKGLYSLSVKNARGESDHEAFFVVTDGVTPEPKIESIALSSDKTITIKGSRFLAKGNVVRTGVNIYHDVDSADGKTIILPLKTMFSNVDTLPKATISSEPPKETKPFSIPVWVFVVNNDGVSNSVNFTLDL